MVSGSSLLGRQCFIIFLMEIVFPLVNIKKEKENNNNNNNGTMLMQTLEGHSKSIMVFLDWLIALQFFDITHVIRRPCWCQNNRNMSIKFCIIIESNSQKTFSILFFSPTWPP